MSETPGTTRRSRREAPTEDVVVEESSPRRAPRAEREPKAPKEPRAPRVPREPRAPKEPKAAREPRAPRGKSAPPTRPVNRPSGVRPSVLLVPPLVAEARARRVLVRRLGLGLGAVVAVSALAVGGAAALGAAAERDLTTATGQNTVLTSEVTRLQPVANYYDGLATSLSETSEALLADVSYSRALRAIEETAASSGVTITSESTDGAAGTKCPGPDPFDPAPAIGCVSIEGSAPTLEGAANYAAAMADYSLDVNGVPTRVLVDPFVVNNASRDGDGFGFTMTVNYDANAYSGRYNQFVPEGQVADQAPPTDDETGE